MERRAYVSDRLPVARGGFTHASFTWIPQGRTAILAWLVAGSTAVVSIAPIADREKPLALIAAVSSLVLLSYTAQRARVHGRLDVLDLGFAGALALFLYFGVRALIVGFTDDPFIPPVVATADESARSLALVAVITGSLACAAGYAIVENSERPRRPRRRAEVATKTALLVGTLLLVIGAPGLVIQALASQAALAGETTQLGSASGIVNVVATLPYYGLLLLGLAFRDGGRLIRALWLSATLGLLAVGVVSLFKEVIVLTALCALVPVHYMVRPLRIGTTVALALIFVLVVVPGIKALRDDRSAGASPAGALVRLPSRLMTYDLRTGDFERHPAPVAPWRYVLQGTGLASRRLAGLDAVVAVTALTPRPNSFRKGDTYLPLLTGIVPRVLWPGKPRTGLGRSFTERYWARGSNNRSAQAITLVGEGYANFGILGVVTLLALVGGLWSLARRVLQPRTGLVLLAYPFVLAAVVAVERNIAYTVVNLGQRLAPLLIIVPLVLIADRRGRARCG